jgi:hypothetical protein
MLALTVPAWADRPDYKFIAGRYDDSDSLTIGVQRTPFDKLVIETTTRNRPGYVERAFFGLGGRRRTPAAGTAWYRLNKMFAIGLSANQDDNVMGFGIGGRIYFGR